MINYNEVSEEEKENSVCVSNFYRERHIYQFIYQY